MLEELDVTDLGPIRKATLRPAPGMTAITGETGAGKSMLLGAIRLISGGQARPEAVTPGGQETWVQAVFDASDNPKALETAREAGIEAEDGELFLGRTVPAKGRSRAIACGHTVPRSVLTALAGDLIVIHGQADQLRIASPARQRDFLDAYAGDAAILAAYTAAWDAYRAAQARLEQVTTQQAQARQRADYLRESIERIDRVDPKDGEYETLRAQRDRLEHAADIAQGVRAALSCLDSGDEDASGAMGAREAIRSATDALRGVRGVDVFDPIVERLESMAADVDDVVFQLSDMAGGQDEAGDLDYINARIHDLDDLARRWGPTIGDVIEWRRAAGLELEDLDASPERVAQLTAGRDAALKEATGKAAALTEARGEAATRLSERVTGELASLAMPDARLRVTVTPAQRLDAHGGDAVEFLFTPFPGAGELPLGKSASGGELSRLMLSMELAAADARAERGGTDGGTDGAGLPTFVFDEVDAGVGGRAAAELGRRLSRLARGAQVIVVTHLAQVASCADAQVVVSKTKDADGATATGVTPVEGEARVREIARMLSGSISDASLRHAAELLSDRGAKED